MFQNPCLPGENYLTGVLTMKRYLTLLFIILSVVILAVGLQFNVAWSSIAAWGLAFISLIFATYYTKYIPNDKHDGKKEKKS